MEAMGLGPGIPPFLPSSLLFSALCAPHQWWELECKENHSCSFGG